MEKVKFEFLDDIDLSEIEIATHDGRWVKILKEWIESGAKACKLTCASPKEKNRCRSAINLFVKKHALDWTVVSERGTYNVYVVRA